MPAPSVSVEPSLGGVHYAGSLESAVREHLERLLGSEQFDASARSRAFLAFIVDEVFSGREAFLSQAVIASAVFGRRGDFDPVLDPIVRVQAGRLRRSLERYYLLARERDSIRIELPKGSYAPHFILPIAAGGPHVMETFEAMEPARERPIMVIHPFRAAAPADDSLAARLTDELATELCRSGNVRVARHEDLERLELARHAAVRFELQGNLHHDVNGERCLAVRLVARSTGEQVWGDSYRLAPLQDARSDNSETMARVVAAGIGAWYGTAMRCNNACKLDAEHDASLKP